MPALTAPPASSLPPGTMVLALGNTEKRDFIFSAAAFGLLAVWLGYQIGKRKR